MHELSIAMEVLDIVEREAARHGAGSVSRIHLRIGDLAGVQADALSFSFDAVKSEKPLTGNAELFIERVPVRVRCTPCGSDFEGGDLLVTCPMCGGFETRLLQGQELDIAGIEIEKKEE